MSIKDSMVHVVVVKTIKDIVGAEEKAAKAEAAEFLDPGDRKGVRLPDGSDVGTVSYTQGRDSSAWQVTNPDALLAWAVEHRPDAVRTVQVVAPWFVASDALAGLVEQGEVPDGVEYVEKTGEPYLTVRQSAGQKAAALEALASGQLDGQVRRALTGAGQEQEARA